MTDAAKIDVANLIAETRNAAKSYGFTLAGRILDTAADALEAQAKQIAEMEETLVMIRAESLDPKMSRLAADALEPLKEISIKLNAFNALSEKTEQEEITTQLLSARIAGMEEVSGALPKWLDSQYIQLMAGDMTAQELRSVKAIVGAIASAIRDRIAEIKDGKL